MTDVTARYAQIMPTPLLCRVTIPDVSAMPADAVVNSYVFQLAASPAACVSALADFYNGANTAVPMAGYLNSSRSRAANAVEVKVTDLTGHLDGTHLSSPVLIDHFTLAATANPQSLPDQVSVVLAYHGDTTLLPEHGPAYVRPTTEEAQDQGAGPTYTQASRPRASLRGRIFFGPVNISAIAVTADVSDTFITDAAQALHRLMMNSNDWSVWTRRYAGMTTVNGGWIDLETGVQRRRKDKAVTRHVWA